MAPPQAKKDELEEMAFVLDFAKHGCWIFALCNDATPKDELVERLRSNVDLPLYIWHYSPQNPYPISYLENLTEVQREQRALVVLFNALEGGAKTIKSLEAGCGEFAQHPHSLVFWITETERNEIAMGAEHFWALRRGVFDFSKVVGEEKPKESDKEEESQSHTYGSGRWLNCLVRVESHQQAQELLDALLQELAGLKPLNPETLSRRSRQLAMPYAQINEKISFLYYYQGRYSEAIPFCEKALRVYKKILGDTLYPEISSTNNNLALLWERLGNFADAEQLLKETMDVLEKRVECQQDFATVLNNLAWVYSAQGDYSLARPLYAQSLKIREKILGPDHPDVASSLNDLAILYFTQGDYSQVEPLFLRSLDIWEQTLGKEHFGVAGALNNLARVYEIEGKFEQAEPLYNRSLAIKEKALGPDHPSVAGSLNNLASLYQSQGKYDEAEAGFRKGLAIRQKVFGHEHPQVARSINSLATLYDKQGKDDEAEECYLKAIEIAEQSLGRFHSETLLYQKNYRQFLKKLGRN